MDTETLKQAFLEMLQVDTERGKTWFFPRNVSNKYTVALGLTAKQLAITIGIGLLAMGVPIVLFRKSTILFVVIYLIFGIVGVSLSWFYFIFKPISARENISVSEYFKQIRQYGTKQKTYYLRPKKQVEKK